MCTLPSLAPPCPPPRKDTSCAIHSRAPPTPHPPGDPRLALERLYERQLKLLVSVRKLWQRADFSRGELPAVPKLPPLHAFPGTDYAPPQVDSDNISGGGYATEKGEDVSRFLPQHFSDLYMPTQFYSEPDLRPGDRVDPLSATAPY